MTQRYSFGTGAIFPALRRDRVKRDVAQAVAGEVSLATSLWHRLLILNERRPHVQAPAPAEVVVDGGHVFLHRLTPAEDSRERLLTLSQRGGDLVDQVTHVIRHTQPAEGLAVAEELRRTLHEETRVAASERELAGAWQTSARR